MFRVISAMLTLIVLAQISFAGPVEHYTVGELLYKSGRYEAALLEFVTALQEAPATELWFDLALVHYKLDNVYASRQCLRTFLRQVGDPRGPVANSPAVLALEEKVLAAIKEEEARR